MKITFLLTVIVLLNGCAEKLTRVMPYDKEHFAD